MVLWDFVGRMVWQVGILHGGKHTDDPANPKGNWQKTAEK